MAAILLGDDPDGLVRDLQDRFPKATLIGADAGHEDVVAKVVGFVEAPQLGLDLPLDVRGTVFQQRVWQALRDIPFGRTQTVTGLAAIAVGRRGVAAVLLGNEHGELRQKLRDALPGAILVEDEVFIGSVLDAVASYVDAPTGERRFGLDLRGEAGELAVWAVLRAIPVGQTRSYGAIAMATGTGMTAQEVGAACAACAACAANRLAVVVPCHRVVTADGSKSGYRWGAYRKRKLLSLEKAA